MAYIGKEPIVGNFQKCDAISVVDGQAAYTLQVGSTNVSPESVNHMIVSLNGVIQNPTTAYTVSGATLTFASNLATGDVIDFVILLGNVLDLGTPSDGTVTNAKLAQDIISGETALTSAPATTDEFLVSDAGTLKRIDFSLMGNTPSFLATLSGDQSLSDATNTKITCQTELYDSDGTYDNSTNYRWTPAVAGKYYIFGGLHFTVDYSTVYIYKNGSALVSNRKNVDTNRENSISISTIDTADADDYYELWGYQASGGSLVTEATQRRTHFGAFKIIGV